MAKLNLAEKYRPTTLDGVIGNTRAKREIREWAETWKRIASEWKGLSEMDGSDKLFRGRDGFRPALVLSGTAGIGKTTCAHALARDMGWDVIELNASDARNRGRIRDVVTRGALNQALNFSDDGSFKSYKDGNLTLIILDEADNLTKRKEGANTNDGEDFSDRGGKEEVIRAIQLTRHPMILIVNDWYALMGPRGGALHQCTRTVRFQEPKKDIIAKVLRRVLHEEGVAAQNVVVDMIAARANGDIRGAINDLEGLIIGRKTLNSEDVTSIERHRDKKKSIFNVMKTILLETDIRKAISSFREADVKGEMVTDWVGENIARIYTRPEELAGGLDKLSKADVFYGRIRRQQYYGFLRYFSQLASGGVCAAKKRRYGWKKMHFPEYIKTMSRTKSYRGTLRTLARKITRHLHVSMEYAKTSFLPYFRIMAGTDNDLVFNTVYEMQLTMEETAVLLDKDNIWSLWRQYLQYRTKRISRSITGSRAKSERDYTVFPDTAEREGEPVKPIIIEKAPKGSIVPTIIPVEEEKKGVEIPGGTAEAGVRGEPTLSEFEKKKEEEDKKKDDKGKKAQISLDSFF